MASSAICKSDGAARGGPQSVGRVLSMLEHVVERREGATLTELAIHANAPKTSLVGLINALVKEGGLRREESGRYVLGERIFALAARVTPGRDLAKLARPFLNQLVKTTGETVVLGVAAEDADMAVYIDKVETDNPIRYTINVGERREMYCSAMGKVLLAYAPPEQIERVLAPGRLKRFTSTTITSAAALREELSAARAAGIARSRGERIEGAAGLAAPIFGPAGQVVASILVAGPSSRVQAHDASIERHLLEASRALSLVLGGARKAPSAPVRTPAGVRV